MNHLATYARHASQAQRGQASASAPQSATQRLAQPFKPLKATRTPQRPLSDATALEILAGPDAQALPDLATALARRPEIDVATARKILSDQWETDPRNQAVMM